MGRKKLAIIGASYLQKPLVLKAKQMGIYTVCFAWEEGAVCRDICDEFYPISITEKKEILNVCKRIGINGILSIASDVAVNTVNFVASRLNLVGNSLSSATLSTNKFKMRNAFYNSGIPVPNFIQLDAGNLKHEASGLKFPLIVKPVDRSGSRGITVVNEYKELEEAVEYALQESFIKRVIIEEFIQGNEISVETISINGHHEIVAYTDKITSGFPHFVELEHHQPSKYCNSFLLESINEVVLRGLKSLEIKNGASHCELILTKENEVYLTEIGARMGGDFIGSDLVYLSTGFDYLKAVIMIALGQEVEVEPRVKNYCSGIYFYSSETKHIKKYLSSKNEQILRSEMNSDGLKKLRQSSDRAGYFIYKSNQKFVIE